MQTYTVKATGQTILARETATKVITEAGDEYAKHEVELWDTDYWYLHRSELRPGMVFRDYQGDLVRLDRGVPGDGTRWYVEDWDEANRSWSSWDSTAEPGDLRGQPLADPAA